MISSVRFSEAIASRVNSFGLDGVDATVALRPVYDEERENRLKVEVVPLGTNIERTTLDGFTATTAVGIGFQQYLGSPLNETRFRELVELVETVQTALSVATLDVDSLSYRVESVYGDALYDETHLTDSSVFTSVLTATATAHFTVEVEE